MDADASRGIFGGFIRSTSGDNPLADLGVEAEDALVLLGLLAIVLIVNNFLQKWNVPVPEAISTIAIGAVFGGIAYTNPLMNQQMFVKLEESTARSFMLIFIAPIIFAEGYGLKSRQFFRNIVRILTHAFLGTFVSTVLVAAIIYSCSRFIGGVASPLTMAECLCFGSLISSTDPVTTLAIFKDEHMVEKGLGYLYYSVLGESILNDAVAITLFTSLSSIVESGDDITAKVSLNIIKSFAITFGASTAIGLVSGCFTALVLKFSRLGGGGHESDHFYLNVPELGVALVFSYIPFLIAEALDMSGIVAIMFAGVAMRHYAHYNLTQVTRLVFLPIVELIATLSETYVFALLGVFVFGVIGDVANSRAGTGFSAALIAYTTIACLFARAVHVYPCSTAVNRLAHAPKLTLNEMHVVWFAGLRGAVAFMCALGFPGKNRTLFLSTTIVVVGMSILFLGWPTSALLRYLDIQPSEENSASVPGPEATDPSDGGTQSDKIGTRMQKFFMTREAYEQRLDASKAANPTTTGSFSGRTLVSHPRLSLGTLAMDGASPRPSYVPRPSWAPASSGTSRPSVGADASARPSVGAGTTAGLLASQQVPTRRTSAPPAGSGDADLQDAMAATRAGEVPAPRTSDVRQQARRTSDPSSGRPSATFGGRSTRMLCDP